jgi:hypothetical protein
MVVTPEPTLLPGDTAPTTAIPTPTIIPNADDSGPAIAPLPLGVVLANTPILFGPSHSDLPLEILPPNAAFTLLGKDQEGNWFRVKEDHTGRRLIGWVPATNTNLPASQTGQVASPPACAAPRAYLEGDGPAPTVTWNSDVSGVIVVVVDVFRDAPGNETIPGELSLKVNGELSEVYPIKPSRQAFLYRGLAVETRISANEPLEFIIPSPVSGEPLRMRASIFYVPPGCSF